MAAANIERFNAVAGAIFAKLYEKFPVPADLKPEDFFELLTTDPDAEYLHRDDVTFFASTVLWLDDHGYLRGGSRHSNGTVTDCYLTASALELLNAVPKSLENKGPSLGDQLVTATKEGVKGKVKELASDFLSKAAVFGVKAATDWAGQ